MSQAGLDVVRQLVAVVARTFYKDEYIIALDYLNWHEIARIDVLYKHLRVAHKEAYRIFSDLEKHKLVQRITRQDEVVLNSPFQRTRKSVYFYVDYRKFVDVVKWRIWKLQGQVQLKTEKEQKNVGYDCPDCKKHFNKMEVLSLMDPFTGMFKCDYCSGELVDNTLLEMELKSRKELTRFTMQSKVILTLLKKTDDITLPPPTPFSEVPVPSPNGDHDGRAGDRGKFGGGKELGVARDTGVASGDTVIVFAPDLTSKEAARIREAELEKKLRQNQLPAWHIWSTVSGVQMVVDQKITTEARLRHLRYGEGQAFRNSSWNRSERDRARTAARELDKQLRALADGQGDHAEAREELDEAKREGFYARFYASVAQRVGMQLPHDPREGYQLLLDQLARDEELERAELERRRLEMEKAEKERKDAEAAHISERNANGGGGGSFRPRGKYHPYKHGRGSYRSARRNAPRLFEFVDVESGTTPPIAGGAKREKKEKEKEKERAGEGPPLSGSDHEMLSQSTVVADMDVCGASLLPDPCVDGIYALSQADRRRLGLDDESMAVVPTDRSRGSAAHLGADVDIYVGGQPKAISSITSDDEGEMSTKEYTDYWHVWHRMQQRA
ncbi:hypothetical protein GGI20_004205 [Coemansia sp. BCRC 34301]|nr:hypothetical protein GGI20_004205 [Coemansia sp. BCRC 34301]